jgi:hypothetical protein
MTTPADRFQQAARGLRASPGYRALSSDERASLDRDLQRIGSALSPARAAGRGDDPYAVSLATPNDLPAPGGFSTPQSPSSSAPAVVQPSPAPKRSGTEEIGERARRVLDAVDFPSFVSGLIRGTFQAIVDATAQQVREYARLVADLAKTVDEFTRDNVTKNQARDHLAQKHAADLAVLLPQPGAAGEPSLVARQDPDASPEWLDQYGLGGEALTPELVEGPLLEAGRRALGEERMRLLANMVLLGISRIVVDDGQVRAKLQFHAQAREQVNADITGATVGQSDSIAARNSGTASGVTTMVSTVNVNAQADVAIRTDLVGEVSVKFRTETFNLERFAEAQSIALINRHALAKGAPAASAAGVSVSSPAPAPASSPSGERT